MNAFERRQYEMLLRVRNFGEAHRDQFASAPTAQEAFESLNAAIDELTRTDLLKLASSPAARAGRKEKARKTLTELLVKVSSLGRVLRARVNNVPSFAIPASRNDQALLTTARQFAQDTESFAEFTAHGVGPDAIKAVATAFEMALRDRGMKRADFTAARTRIHDLIASALLDVRRLDLLVDNEFTGNNSILTVWKQARHVDARRGPRASDTSSDTVAAPTPAPTPTPEPEQMIEPAPAHDAEVAAPQSEAPKPATVIEMPSREAA